MKKKRLISQSVKQQKPARSRAGFLLFFLVVLCLSIFFFGGFSRFGNAMASNAINAGKLEKAKSWLDFVERFSSPTGQSFFERARCSRIQGDLDQMASYLRKAMELGFDKVAMERQQTIGLVSIGTPDPASEERMLAWIRETPPDISDLVRSYANGLVTQSRYEDATELLELYRQDFPSDPMPHYRLGRIDEHFERYEVAGEHYRKSLQADPEFAPAAFAMARIESHDNHFPEALAIYEKLYHGKAELAARLGAAKSLRMMGDLEASRQLLRTVYEAGFEACNDSFRSVDESPAGRFIAAAELGKIDLDLGDLDASLIHIESALQTCSNDYSARMTYVQVLKRLGRKEEAETESEKNRLEQEAFEKITMLRSKVKRSEKDVEARFELGKLLMETESEDVGIYWIKGVLVHDPNHENALRCLSDYYLRKASSAKDTLENSSMQKLATLYRDQLNKIVKEKD